MSKWISAKERMPEYHEDVLVSAFDFDDMDPFPLPMIAHLENWKGKEAWVFNTAKHGLSQKNYGIYVTHWMPLPEPPKEE